jgi:hypothetical protein
MSDRFKTRLRRSKWTEWIHFSGLIVLAALLQVGVAWLARTGEGLDPGAALVQSLQGVPAFLYGALPAMAAISCGLLAAGANRVRKALRITVSATLMMAVIDIASPPVDAVLGSRVGVVEGDIAVRTERVIDLGRVSALRTLHSAAVGGLPGIGERAESYPLSHPRAIASAALHKGALLLAPLLLVGIIVGVQSWLADHVVFRREVDQRVGHLVMAWVIAPAGEVLLFTWSGDLRAQVLFAMAPLWSILVPYVPFLVVAVVAWRTAHRQGQMSELAPRDQ